MSKSIIPNKESTSRMKIDTHDGGRVWSAVPLLPFDCFQVITITDMTSEPYSYLQSARRAAQWIIEQQKPDGSFFEVEAGIGAYYKVPYCLAMTGFTTEAVRLLRWVRKHHFTPEGDFTGPIFKARNPFHQRWITYSNAWLIQGAHRLGQFDLSFRGAEFLLQCQTPRGGFTVVEDGQSHVDCLSTSWGGMALLTVGKHYAAAAAVRCLEQFVIQQPDPERFYFRMTPEGELISRAPRERELLYFVNAVRRKQMYYQMGIPLILLCRWFQVTGEASALQGARTLFAFAQRCADDVYRFPTSAKTGFGSALLGAITGEPEPRHAAITVADYLLGTQTREGYWRLPDENVYQIIPDKDDPEILIGVTGEYGTFLCEIAALL